MFYLVIGWTNRWRIRSVSHRTCTLYMQTHALCTNRFALSVGVLFVYQSVQARLSKSFSSLFGSRALRNISFAVALPNTLDTSILICHATSLHLEHRGVHLVQHLAVSCAGNVHADGV